MLTELSIKNFAIIDDLTIHFSDGLTILSGETGAGKSIIINAVNLILGSRATARMIRTGAETAEIEAMFQAPETSPARRLLADQGVDDGGVLLIRRVISRNERHRLYVNGRLATMQTLNVVTENLAAIAGQHEHQRLLNESAHLLLLDQGGGLLSLRQQVADQYAGILPLIREMEDLTARRKTQNAHIQLLEFQKKEIEDAGLVPGEDIALKQEQARLKNAESLFQTIQSCLEMLYHGEGAVAERLGEVKRQVENAARIDTLLAGPAEALGDMVFHIDDICREFHTYLDGIQFDPARLEAVAARLDQISRLKRKYGENIEEILGQLGVIRGQLGDMERLDERMSDLEQRLRLLHEGLETAARELSRRRREASEHLARQVEGELHDLKMPNTRFTVAFSDAPASPATPQWLVSDGRVISETGMEQACFMIAPNVGEALKPLSQIASGGELSRVVLALKSITSGDGAAGVMIFDEVDTGIGGEVAEVVGRKLLGLAKTAQVICITHLAQIAVFGHHHYKIAKHIESGRTFTRICPLTEEQRLEEIARMIAGEKITPASRRHAAEMLENSRRWMNRQGFGWKESCRDQCH